MTWPTKRIGDTSIMKITSGGTPSRSNSDYYNGDIFWLTSGELNDNRNISQSIERITEKGLENSSAKIFPKNTVLFAMYGATAGKLGILGTAAATNQAIAGMICDETQLHFKYLYYFLVNCRETIVGRAWGGAQPNISQTILKDFAIPLAPLPEQRRIVKKIEKLFAKIDEALLVRGKAKSDAGEIMLAVLDDVFEKAGEKGWKIKEVKDICEHPQYGYTASSQTEPVGPKLLRITDIQDGKVDWDRVPYCRCENIDKYRLAKNDIVFARTGATVGKSYIVEEVPENSVFASYLIRLRVADMILPKFLYHFFQSRQYWQQITDGQVGMAQPNVNGSKLARLKIPLPPISEQKMIVGRLDSLSENVQRLQKLQEETENDLKELKKAILERAFAGKL